ncbi:MAG: hypothetical protein U0835_05410 [Isosphaeraceae bacterium]
MKNRRGFLLSVVAAVVAMGVVVAPAIADELLGVITKVDVEGKKLMVLPKGEDKEIEVKVTDTTEVVTKKGSAPVDLTKIEKAVQKQIDAGKKGVMAKIEHEKAVASKIQLGGIGKKKAQPQN